jgi:hypothetical protein
MNTSLESVPVHTIDFLEDLGMALWIEIISQLPDCIYYFGPYASKKEAELAIPGYLEDLETEKADIIATNIKRGQPVQLTIFEDDLENFREKELDLGKEFASFVKAVYY